MFRTLLENFYCKDLAAICPITVQSLCRFSFRFFRALSFLPVLTIQGWQRLCLNCLSDL